MRTSIVSHKIALNVSLWNHALIVLAFLVSFSCSAQTTEQKVEHVQAALLLKSLKEPLIGEAICAHRGKCDLISRPDIGITVSVDLLRPEDGGAHKLYVSCPLPCSFNTGRDSIGFRDQRAFDLFEGENNDTRLQLVLRPRKKIGEISLILGRTEALQRPPI